MIWLLIGYMFLFVHRPFEVWPVLGDMHLERVYMLMTLAFFAVSPQKRWKSNFQNAAYVAFAVAVVVCWLMSPWMDKGQDTVENWFKIFVFYVLLVSVVNDEESLRRIVFAFLVIMCLYMMHSLWEYRNGRHTFRMGIARMIGVDQTLGDPNSFGGSIVYALPLVLAFWRCQPTFRVKAFLLFYVMLSAGCVLLTGSRSSFLGLLVWCLYAVLVSKQRWKVILPLLLAAPLVWTLLPPSLQTRFETIIDPSVGPANAIESGESRWDGLFTGIELFGKNPLTGIGPGAWRVATGKLLESHNLYGQLLGELGGLGGAAFFLILIGFLLNLRWQRKHNANAIRDGPCFCYEVTMAIGVAVLLMLFEGNFGHNLFRFNWLWYGGFVILNRHCVSVRAEAAEEKAVAEEEPHPAVAGYI
jgi:hypothetical protein